MFVKKVIENAVILAILTQGWCLKPFREYVADRGQNLTLPCLALDSDKTTADTNQSGDVMWVRDGREQITRFSIQVDGSLVLTTVTGNDSGIYSCSVENENSEDIDIPENSVKVRIKTPPPPLVNVTVHPSTILALVLWNVADNGGYPIINFTAEYRLYRHENGTYAPEDTPWKSIYPNHIPPNSRQIDVYHLIPNTTYAFRVWATNVLGQSDKVIAYGHTLQSDEEAELARHFLTGAENFDTRVWVVAVAVVMGTLVILTAGTCLLLYRECKVPSADDNSNQESMELVPNIILNPGYCEQSSLQDRRDSDETTKMDNYSNKSNRKDSYSYSTTSDKVKTIINNDTNIKMSNGFAITGIDNSADNCNKPRNV